MDDGPERKRPRPADRPAYERYWEQTGELRIKSKICRHFMAGYCPYGDSCYFAHGEHELRPRHCNPADEDVIAGSDDDCAGLMTMM